jgi:hypothetical protein
MMGGEERRSSSPSLECPWSDKATRDSPEERHISAVLSQRDSSSLGNSLHLVASADSNVMVFLLPSLHTGLSHFWRRTTPFHLVLVRQMECQTLYVRIESICLIASEGAQWQYGRLSELWTVASK